jgi:hypothetical protein
MVQQMSVSSHEFPKGVNEFVKAGFTQLPSERVRPFRVKESPVQFECKVKQVIETGDQGGAGNLVICEIVLMHINEAVLDAEGKIDPNLIDLVARMGYHWYCRASGSSLFEVTKPNLKLCVGMDHLPDSVRNSDVLTGNELGVLANEEHLPTEEEVAAFAAMEEIQQFAAELKKNPASAETARHLTAKELIKAKKIADAWKVLLMK